jgi:lipoyl(octanoyl) transferase
MDLEPFGRINPCGYQGLAVTQVLDLGGPGSLAAVEAVLIGELARQLGLEAIDAAHFPRIESGDAARAAHPA